MLCRMASRWASQGARGWAHAAMRPAATTWPEALLWEQHSAGRTLPSTCQGPDKTEK